MSLCMYVRMAVHISVSGWHSWEERRSVVLFNYVHQWCWDASQRVGWRACGCRVCIRHPNGSGWHTPNVQYTQEMHHKSHQCLSVCSFDIFQLRSTQRSDGTLSTVTSVFEFIEFVCSADGSWALGRIARFAIVHKWISLWMCVIYVMSFYRSGE